MKVDIMSILFIVFVALSCYLVRGITALLGVVFGVIMFMLIYKLGGKIGKFLLTKEYVSFKTAKKMGLKSCILYDERFRLEHKGFWGSMNVAMRITWIGLGVGLLSLRIMLDRFKDIIAMGIENIGIGEIVIVSLIAIVIATIISPMAVPYWVINSSRIRIVNTKIGTISLPGSFLRSIFRGLFGAGNIAIFAYFILASINVMDDIIEGLKLAFLALILVFGTIGVAAIVASTILLFKGTETLNNVLRVYEDLYSAESMSEEEFMELMRQYLTPIRKEEEVEEKPKEGKEQPAEGMVEEAQVEVHEAEAEVPQGESEGEEGEEKTSPSEDT